MGKSPRSKHIKKFQIYFWSPIIHKATIAVLSFIPFLLLSCSFDEPVLPSWTVPLNVPLAEETFNLGEEIVNDSTIVVQGADSLIYISFDGDLEGIELSAADFSIEAIDTLQTFEMGSLELDSLDMLSTGDVSLGTIFPELESMVVPGETIPFTIPDTTFSPPSTEVNAGDFMALHVVNGALRIKFINNLPFSVGPNASHPEGIRIALFDSTAQQITEFTIDEIVPPGAQIEKVSELGNGGTWIYSPLSANYILPVAEETTVYLNESLLDTTGIAIDVTLENLEVDEAYALIEEQEIEEEEAVALENENRVREAVIDRGRIQLDFTNNTLLNSTVEFTIPNLLDAQHQPYSDMVSISENGTASLDVQLDGMRITNHFNPGDFVDSLYVDYRALTNSSTNLVHIQSTDNFSIHVQVDSIFFQSFSGFLAADTFNIDPFEEDSLVDYEGVPNSFRLSNVDLGLTLSNEVYIENMFVDLNIIGYHKDESGAITDSAIISIAQQQINPGTPGNPELSVISLTGPEVADFLNILPTTIRTSGRVCASGNVEISQNSSVSGQYHFSTPMRFRIEGDALVNGDVEVLEDEDIDQEIQDAAEDNFREASLSLLLTNHTPVGGSIRVIVSADPDHEDIYDSTYFNPALEFIKEIAITPAPSDPNTGFVLAGEENELSLSLSNNEFRLFQHPPLRVGYQLRIDGTNEVIALRSIDFIKISGLARVVLNVKD